jgi:tetratricopeptide (TPR) repeat protein
MSPLRRLPLHSLALLGLLAAFATRSALAADADAERRIEARERFDRGLTLFNQGDNLGALAEFQRAYQLTKNALVLSNIARVQAASGDPVAALETLDKLLAEPGELNAARQAQLKELRREQLQRVGAVLVTANVPGARVEIDGMDAGALDPATPLRLSAGRHVLGVLAPQHHPLRKTVLVAGQEQKTVEFALEPLAGALGRVRFQVEPIDVSVELDGQELGKTPNLVEVAVAPGRHRLALKRPGYRSVTRDIVVPEAGALEVSEKLAFDLQSRSGHQGTLQVRPSEEEAVVFVNGAVLGRALTGVELPEGQHRLRVERAGFLASERTVHVPRGKAAIIDVTLAPTATYRADYAASASARRAWGLGLGLGGAALAGASVGYVVWNGGKVNDAERDYDAAYGEAKKACSAHSSECEELLEIAGIRQEDSDSKKNRQVLGWAFVGVGAAALTTGAVLWLTGNDPRRYEPKPESDVFGSLELAPWFHPAGGGLALTTAL